MTEGSTGVCEEKEGGLVAEGGRGLLGTIILIHTSVADPPRSHFAN